MHDFIVSIGQTVYDFFAKIDPQNLTDALSIVGIGMLGIFIVTGVIILVVAGLNKLGSLGQDQ